MESVSFSVIVDYWTNTVSRTVLITPGPIYYHTVYFKEFGEFIQCYISVYHIFSSSSDDNASLDTLDKIGQITVFQFAGIFALLVLCNINWSRERRNKYLQFLRFVHQKTPCNL